MTRREERGRRNQEAIRGSEHKEQARSEEMEFPQSEYVNIVAVSSLLSSLSSLSLSMKTTKSAMAAELVKLCVFVREWEAEGWDLGNEADNTQLEALMGNPFASPIEFRGAELLFGLMDTTHIAHHAAIKSSTGACNLIRGPPAPFPPPAPLQQALGVVHFHQRFPLPHAKPKQRTRPKHSQDRIITPATPAKREKLARLYNEFGDRKDAEWYAGEVVLNKFTVIRLLNQLKNHIDITFRLPRGRPKSVNTPFMNEYVRRMLRQEPRRALRKISAKAKTENVKISPTSVHRLLSESNPETGGHPIFTFKKMKLRSPSANTPENKQRRKEFVCEWIGFDQQGYRTIFIDESAWNAETIRRYGWSEINKPAVLDAPPRILSFSLISAISEDGVHHSEIVRGPVNHHVFESYIKRLLASLPKDDTFCFIMDNCSIHNVSTDQIITEANHFLAFNAAYSPDLNPIEQVFGFWKAKVERDVRTWYGEEAFIDGIRAAFDNLDKREIRRTIQHVKTVIWPKVMNDEDL
ncbi:hypothetical protein BLNAU_22308 [Blattamonas nauphoetae]|uniref:Tc1-like transposase DDE domain-containing protein n=1 Tax=Blattamonas nauphoetae TaxID=2049346 RepID=A0ABQ9WXQ4_9EUKA|nr:hypothetical protein BLNAU_22308 [Blattamonas nauphoetae]